MQELAFDKTLAGKSDSVYNIISVRCESIRDIVHVSCVWGGFYGYKENNKKYEEAWAPGVEIKYETDGFFEKEYIKKDKAGKPIGKRDCVSCSFCVCHFVAA